MKKIRLKIHKITRERTRQRCNDADRNNFFDAKHHGKAFQSSLGLGLHAFIIKMNYSLYFWSITAGLEGKSGRKARC